MSETETDRLADLRSYGVLDTPAEARFDGLTALAADLFETPMAVISLIDHDRQWFKSVLGIAPGQTPRQEAFCDHTIRLGAGEVMVVPDARADPRFRDNPQVVGPPYIRFYAGAVLHSPDGHGLGSLCVIDTRPRDDFGDRDRRRLSRLAALAMDELELSRVAHHAAARLDLLHMAEAMSGVGHWRLNAADHRVFWSTEVYRIHGVEPGAFDPNLGGALDFYHPEDRTVVTDALERALTQGRDFAFELRLTRADGALRRVRSRGVCQRDATGQVVAVTGVFQDVTEDADRIERAERSERRYRLLADHMGDVITRIRLDGSSSYISPAIVELLGWTGPDMRGRSALEFVHPDDRSRILGVFTDLAQGRDSLTVEHRALHRDGASVWVETRFRLVRDAEGQPREIVAVIRDIQARKAAEAALAESDGRYRLLAENANDMIARMKPGGEILLVTPGCRHVLGLEPEALIGRRTVNLMHPDDLPAVQAYFRSLEGLGPGGRLPPYQFRARHAQGHWVWLEGQPRLVFDPKAAVCIEVEDVVRDITARKRLEQDLEAAKTEAEVAAAAKSDFLSTMSHEIRTPLNGVLGFAEILAGTALDEEQGRYVQRIRTAGKGLSRLIDDILDVAKVEAGKMTLEARPFDLRRTVEEVVDLTRQAQAGRPLAFSASVEGGVVSAQTGDEQRLRQILLNLLGNAAKFTPEGRVDMRVAVREGKLVLTVSDTGVGIAPEALDRLFESFTQADPTVSRRFGGSGLGLSISRSLARLMGGDLVLDSREGEGTQVTLTLPDRPTTIGTGEASTGPALSERRRLRILAVDDVEANLELVSLFLSRSGHSVVALPSGEAALDRLGVDHAFDLVLMDIQMPGLDGLETTRRIRALQGPASDIPVVALSANVLPEQVAACRAAGMVDHIRKPVTAVALDQALARLTPSGSEGKTVTPADAPAPADPLAALRDRYRRTLEDLPAQLDVLAGAPPATRWVDTGRLAHKLAGTAGAFGFHAVSEAAFALEAACDAAVPGADADAVEQALGQLRGAVEAAIRS